MEETRTEPLSTYEFRWDVEVPGTERRFGQKFMKQWKRVLQAQKMAALVTAKLSPHHARFQVCVGSGSAEAETEAAQVRAREQEIAEELSHLRWANGSAQECIEGEPPSSHPAGWQGVRVWMTFSRQDVESALGKKAKI